MSAHPPPLVRGGLPGVGQIDLLTAPLEALVDAAAEHGPVFRFRVPGGREVTFISSSVAREIMALGVDGPLSRHGLFQAFANEAGVDIFGLEGVPHARLAALLRLGYSRMVGAQFMPEMIDQTRAVVRRLHPGTTFDFFSTAEDLTARAMLQCITPGDTSFIVPDLRTAANHVMFVEAGILPSLILINPLYKRAKERLDQVIADALDRHIEGAYAGRDRLDLIDAFLAARDADGQPMSRAGVMAASRYALAGTLGYTGRLLGFLMYEILRDPDLHAGIRREVEAGFAQPGGLDATVLRRMPLLQATYLETLRLYPLIPGQSFEARHDFEVQGCSIEKGAQVVVTFIPDHFDGRFYRRPQVFDAQRCTAPRNEHRTPGAFAPFGLKPRACLAAGLTEVITLTLAATVISEVDLRLERPTYRPKLVLRPLVTASSGIPVRVLGASTPAPPLAGALSTVPVGESFGPRPSLPAAELVSAARGHKVVVEGENADAFYIILEGRASVWKKGERARASRVAALEPGQAFGEIGLLKGVPRTATVRADSRMKLLRIGRDAFTQIVASSDFTAPDVAAALRAGYLDSALARALGPAAKLPQGLALIQVPAGKPIVKQGEPSDRYFVVAAGLVSVLARGPDGPERELTRLGPGEGFGEIGVLTGQPRSATVRAEEDTALVCLSAEQLRAIVESSSAVRDELFSLIHRRVQISLETGSAFH